MRLLFTLLLAVSITASFAVPTSALYGNDPYGGCTYGTTCVPPVDDTPPPADETPDEEEANPPQTAQPITPLPGPDDNDDNRPRPSNNNPPAPQPTPRPYDGNRLTGLLLQGNPVYQAIGEFIKSVPPPVAYSFPYFLLFLLLLLIIRLILQTKEEVRRLNVIKATVEIEKRLLLEKDNFTMLSSHYLRTPVTIAQGGIDLMKALNQITAEVALTLSKSSQLLLDQISQILERIESDKKLAKIQTSTRKLRLRDALSPFVVIPVGCVIVVIAVAHFLFIDFRVTSPTLVDLIVQILLAILLVQLVFAKLRNREIYRLNRRDSQRVLTEQRSLDAARSSFISQVATSLEAQIKAFRLSLATVAQQEGVGRVSNALDQLAGMVTKFRLVALLQTGSLEASVTTCSTREITDTVIAACAPQAQAKSITLSTTVQEIPLIQQQTLIETALSAILDNAIKFSPVSGTVEISTVADAKTARFIIRDNGPGISKSKQDLLFKPFSRANSVEVFDTEGLGFSLYLGKIIAHYLGGDINLISEQDKGTTVEMTVALGQNR